MKPFTQIALSTGHVFEVPTDVIAQNRAKTMQELHKDEFPDLESALADTRELFDDGYKIRDWALNQMNPSEYLAEARLIRFIPPVQEFDTAEWSYHDHRATMGELDGEQIMRQPVEAVLSTMAASDQLVNMTILSGGDGKPFGSLVLIIGNEPVIGAFASTIEFTANQLTNKTQETPTH